MNTAFHVVTPPAFERHVRRIIRRNPDLVSLLSEMISVLESDPYNLTQQHHIKKLTDVKEGKGQWRIRQGDYRLRYDIFDREVVLYSFNHRREVY